EFAHDQGTDLTVGLVPARGARPGHLADRLRSPRTSTDRARSPVARPIVTTMNPDNCIRRSNRSGRVHAVTGGTPKEQTSHQSLRPNTVPARQLWRARTPSSCTHGATCDRSRSQEP